MRNIIISFIAVGGAVFYDFFVADLSAAMTIALALTGLLAAAAESASVEFYDSAEAVALIKRSNNIRIRFPFRRGSKVIKFPMNGATAAIEKTQKECKK